MTNNGIWWPDNLEYINLHNLDCYLDWEPSAGNAWLVHAYAGGVEITELLKTNIVRDIEQTAAQKFQEAQQCSPF